jgi:protein tyrosine/serine phosphatase
MDDKNLVQIPLGLNGSVYRSPMPFAAFDYGKTTLTEFLDAEIDTIIMLTESGEDLLRAGRDLAQAYASHQIETVHFPIVDFDTPDDHHSLLDTLEDVIRRAQEGENIAVHCFAGRGRTGMFIALLARKALGLEGQAAIEWVRNYFPAIETQEQERLVRELELDRP